MSSRAQSEYQSLISAMTAYMTTCMSGHDPSHNPAHVHRVVKLAHEILTSERARSHTKFSSDENVPGEKSYDDTIITLSAILHDIGDRKYLPALTAATTKQIEPTRMVYDVLIAHGADATVAERVQTIVSNVSYSNEVKNPERVRELVRTEGYRELAIVQDADRLDALGAVGIGRCFVYLGSQGEKRRPKAGMNGENGEYPAWEMEESIEHFVEKLERLEGMMKTETGREMAKVRTQRLIEFRKWWEEETGFIA
jgi:uncharacterized protein